MRFGPEQALVEAELTRRHSLDHTWTFHVDITKVDGDGGIEFTAEVVREYEPGGRWCWFSGRRAGDGTWSIEAAEPHEFGPEGPDERVVRARRRAIGRPVLDEARVGIDEDALRRQVPALPRWPITRVSRERVDGNDTVFDFATLGWEGTEPRYAVWYVGTARVDLDTYVASLDVREHPTSRALRRLELSRNEIYTGMTISREGGSEAAGDYMEWTEQVEESREQLAARFSKRPGVVVT